MKGLRFKGQLIVLIETKSDGECLFHSLVSSNMVYMTDAFILRHYIYEKISELLFSAEKAVIVSTIYQILQNQGESLQDFTNHQKQSGQWGLTLDIAFASLVLQINVVLISNIPKKFETFSMLALFKSLKVDQCIGTHFETLYIYHHLFERPFTP